MFYQMRVVTTSLHPLGFGNKTSVELIEHFQSALGIELREFPDAAYHGDERCWEFDCRSGPPERLREICSSNGFSDKLFRVCNTDFTELCVAFEPSPGEHIEGTMEELAEFIYDAYDVEVCIHRGGHAQQAAFWSMWVPRVQVPFLLEIEEIAGFSVKIEHAPQCETTLYTGIRFTLHDVDPAGGYVTPEFVNEHGALFLKMLSTQLKGKVTISADARQFWCESVEELGKIVIAVPGGQPPPSILRIKGKAFYCVPLPNEGANGCPTPLPPWAFDPVYVPSPGQSPFPSPARPTLPLSYTPTSVPAVTPPAVPARAGTRTSAVFIVQHKFL
jgi:hypothetical protein